jgi:hypothetical protein
MNFRLMPHAHLLVLRDTRSRKLAGWCGFDYQYNPSRPELFSLYVLPEYRRLKLGPLLEHVRARYLLSVGVTFGYVRMESATNTKLLERRLASGNFRRLEPAELGAEYLDMCKHCELFGKACTQQAFIGVDLAALARSGEALFGEIDIKRLPSRVDVRAWVDGQLRSTPRAVGAGR